MAAPVLLIGGGGREHAIAWKLIQSKHVSHVYVAPGNAGTATAVKMSNVELNIKDFASIATWCSTNKISLVVVGPEDPLADGIVDSLSKEGIQVFGPSSAAAQIEASKEFAKAFMDRHDIPTARWRSFTDVSEAQRYINESHFPALVVKASGLAAGKGVVVAGNREEACQAANQMLQGNQFGKASQVIVVEELLDGTEVSCLAFTDGTTVKCLPPAQDHKRLLDGDKGPNTGGMGAFSPCPAVTPSMAEEIRKNILQKTIDALRAEGITYKGILYAGLMLTADGPKVLEFNCRFGDPETQVLMPLMKSDLYEAMLSCVNGTLNETRVEFELGKHAVATVLASNGYPGTYKKGMPITNVENVENRGICVYHAGTNMKNGQVVTNGGRVLATVVMATSLRAAIDQSQLGASQISFEGKIYRTDIARKYVPLSTSTSLTYSSSGVDIAAGNRFVEKIKPIARSTRRPGCMSGLGGFGGLFDLKAAGFIDPILVSGMDGVGTKLIIAQACHAHRTVGVDLVAMCVNDILAHGAVPLFFLDYISSGKLDVEAATEVVRGVADGCRLADAALLGGETAEMPGLYGSGEYDLAGCAVGAVERSGLLPKPLHLDDVLIGLPSSGLHSNGFSLVRSIVAKLRLAYSAPAPFNPEKSLGESLLTPTRIYCRALKPLFAEGLVSAFAHITGGGLVENLPRVLSDDQAVELDAELWTIPAVFGWLKTAGQLTLEEMSRTFNCGLGAVLIVKSTDADKVLSLLRASGEEQATLIGKVVATQPGAERVHITNLSSALAKAWQPSIARLNGFDVPNGVQKKKVAVLISGSGTNLQALIDYAGDASNMCHFEVALVISNKANVLGLQRAEKAGIPTKVIPHKNYDSRSTFEDAIHDELVNYGINFVCLAGFMRILTGKFVAKWSGRMLNIHPSLLPAFKGANAHEQVLKAGVRVTGCTVHFVVEEIDSGCIVEQRTVPVLRGDSLESLSERVKLAEHEAFPTALEMVASGQVYLDDTGAIMWH